MVDVCRRGPVGIQVSPESWCGEWATTQTVGAPKVTPTPAPPTSPAAILLVVAMTITTTTVLVIGVITILKGLT